MAAITAAIMAASALASAGSSVYSADKQAKAANTAAAGQQVANDKAMALQQGNYDQTRSDLQPYTQAGYSALDQLQTELATKPEYAAFSFGPEPDYGKLDVSADAYKESPGLKTALDRGMSDIDSRLYAKGVGKSGGAAKQLADYATGTRLQDYNDFRDYTTSQYNNNRNFLQSNYQNNRAFAYNDYTGTRDFQETRRQNLLTSLYRVAGIGQQAAGTTASAGAANAANQGNLLTSNADNQGDAIVNATGARAKGVTDAVGQITTAANSLGSSYKSPAIVTNPTFNPATMAPTTTTNVGRLSSTIPSFSVYR